MVVIHDYDQNQDNVGASLPGLGLPGSDKRTRPPGYQADEDPLKGLFTLSQRTWLGAHMDYDEYVKLGTLDEGDTVDPVVPMIKAMISRVGEKPLAQGVETRSADYVIALAKDFNAQGVGKVWNSEKWLDELDKEDDFFFPNRTLDHKSTWTGDDRDEDYDDEGARRKRAKFSRPVPDNLQGVYAFPDELSGGIGKEPIPIPPEFITEFYFKVGPKTVLSKTLTESAARTLTVKSVEEDPFEKGMWNIEVVDNNGGSVPKIRIQEVKLGINLFNMDGLYKLTVQELTAKKAPDWLIRRAEELRLIQKTRRTEDGNTELMVGAGASALLLLLLFI